MKLPALPLPIGPKDRTVRSLHDYMVGCFWDFRGRRCVVDLYLASLFETTLRDFRRAMDARGARFADFHRFQMNRYEWSAFSWVQGWTEDLGYAYTGQGIYMASMFLDTPNARLMSAWCQDECERRRRERL